VYNLELAVVKSKPQSEGALQKEDSRCCELDEGEQLDRSIAKLNILLCFRNQEERSRV